MKNVIYLLTFLSLSSAFAAGGYEKQSLWSPQAVGVGGAYSSVVRGSDSILYNPANMDKNEVGVNLSTISGYMKSPMQNGSNEKTNEELIFSGGLAASYKLSERWGLGFGAYGLAGLDTRYEKVNYGADFNNYKKDFYANLAVVEYSLGASYKITNRLSIGAAVRAQSFSGAFGQTSVYGNAMMPSAYLVSSEIKDLKGSEFGSYRLGLNYSGDRWGVGSTYRSEVTGTLEGKSSGEVKYNPLLGATDQSLAGSKTKVEGNIPKQVNIDAHYDIIPNKLKVLTGYSWTQYSKNAQLKIKGTLDGTSIPNMNQKWHDLNDYKLGFMFLAEENVFSFGGTYSSAVTNKNYASPNAAPPGPYMHYSAAWSHQYSSKFKFDVALEYYEASAKGKTEQVAGQMSTTTGGAKGNYSSGVLASFFGVRYSF